MSEQDTILSTERPNTLNTLLRDIGELGIKRGDTLLVHSSLSSIGWVCGGEETVVRALLGALGSEGTLVMPAHSGANSDPAQWSNPPVPQSWIPIIYEAMPAYDKRITPTRGIGRIAEVFRSFPGTLRSDHPQTSFCANGARSEYIAGEHALTPQLGMNTPLGKLYDMRAKVLLLGVGFANSTCFHLAESMAGGMPGVRMGASIVVDGHREWVWFEDIDYNSDDFGQLGVDYEGGAHCVSIGKIGNAVCRLFDMRDAVDFAVGWLREHRAV